MTRINIRFLSSAGRSILATLPSNFTMPDFINLIHEKIGGVNQYTFVVRGKQLELQDESRWDDQRNLITNGCSILILERLFGGCFLADTLVMRADKSVVPINTIQVGDDLLSFNSSGEMVTTTVQETFIRHVDDYIELTVGEDKTVLATSDHWMYVGKESFAQLGNLHINDTLFVLSENNTLVAEMITEQKSITAPLTSVYNLHTTEPHTYFANGIAVHNMSGNMGADFVDVGNETALQHIGFSTTAPAWRVAKAGLCLEGKCLNTSCAAHGQEVIINIGFGQFNIVGDVDAKTSKCPICSQYVHPTTCAFTDCLWRWSGKKTAENGLPPVEILSCDWKKVENAYDRFDEQTSKSVRWLKLVLETKPLGYCVVM